MICQEVNTTKATLEKEEFAMNLIVAVDNNWAIGSEGDLLVHLPKDLRRFKEITKDKFVIMGRKTLESLPNGEPLKDRVNIILTRDKTYVNNKVLIVNSVKALLQMVEDLSIEEPNREFFICGGGEIYRQLLPYTKKAIITKINYKAFAPDTFFPNLDKLPDWKITSKKEGVGDGDYITDYIIYERII